MSMAIHCDTCDTWSRGTMTLDFLTVYWCKRNLHFCSWDCILKHAAALYDLCCTENRPSVIVL